MSSLAMIARVAVFAPVDEPLDYRVPKALERELRRGTRVWVPLGRRAVEGVVLALAEEPGDALRPIDRLVGEPPLFPDQCELGAWLADYYMAPPGEVMRHFLPVGGGAKLRRRFRLTSSGQALVDGLRAALVPPTVEALPTAQRNLLPLLPLDEAAHRRLSPAQRRALLQLVEAHHVAVEELLKTAPQRTESWLVPGRRPAADELDRAPKRAALLAEIVAQGAVPRAALAERAGLVLALLDAGLLVCEERARPWLDTTAIARTTPPVLNPEQQLAVDEIVKSLDQPRSEPFLLHGITGSGKTEVYLAAIAATLERGRSALVLVPEIALTPQLGQRFAARFGDAVAILHSGIGDAARQQAWQRLATGQARIALGARSAVFAPLPALGVVVIDEEHDSSFKQEDGVRYSGRDAALVRARQQGAVAVLGSATPSLEIFQAAAEGRIRKLVLSQRATARPLPSVQIVDLKQHVLPRGELFSAPLRVALQDTLARGEQAIVFLNRRGFSTFVLCTSCGEERRCVHCSVTLTFHKQQGALVCHYCGHREALPPRCPKCGGGPLERLGVGTEQVESQLAALLPTARLARLDRDTANELGSEAILDRVRRREVDILVGTQMLAKGHDFPSVTLVGVVLADGGMGLPDFRATERTFQLLVQVAGRAGRGDEPGRVVVQTYNPEHPAVVAAAHHDYQGFVDAELPARRELHYPPFGRLACIRFDGVEPAEVEREARAVAAALQERIATASGGGAIAAQIVGPAEAPLGRLKGRTRWQLFLKGSRADQLRGLCRAALATTTAGQSRVRRTVDVDPVSML